MKNIRKQKNKMGETMRASSFSLAAARYSAGDFAPTVLQSVDQASLKIRTSLDNVAGVKLPAFHQYVRAQALFVVVVVVCWVGFGGGGESAFCSISLNPLFSPSSAHQLDARLTEPTHKRWPVCPEEELRFVRFANGKVDRDHIKLRVFFALSLSLLNHRFSSLNVMMMLMIMSLISGSLLQCKENFVSALESLVALATLQTSFLTLDEAIKITNRRVNAIEYVIQPKIENTISYIKVRHSSLVEWAKENGERNSFSLGCMPVRRLDCVRIACSDIMLLWLSVLTGCCCCCCCCCCRVVIRNYFFVFCFAGDLRP